MKRTFDEEAKRWLYGQGDVIDYNIQPPGYSSVEMMKYSIEELDTYKVIMDEKVIGGIISYDLLVNHTEESIVFL